MISRGSLPAAQTHAPIRWFFVAGLALVTLKVGADLLGYPAVLATAGWQGPIYLLLLAAAMLAYGWFALVRTRAATASAGVALREGTRWGLLCGGAWIVELCAANLLGSPSGGPGLAIYFGATAAGFLLPGLAGALAAWRARRLRSGIEAGLLCGMLGGLLIFLAYSAMSGPLLQAGRHDPQMIREFQRSGLPDLATYIVGDYLAAMVAHLWIGLLTGAVLGALGAIVGAALADKESDRRR